MKSAHVVFIHGMYMTPLCWEHWLERFRAKGRECHAPAWPGRDHPVEELRRRHPDAQLGALALSDVLDHLTRFIGTLEEKPVLVGHSMGGLAAQILLQRGLGCAAVAIDSAPPVGVFSAKWSFLKSNWPHITPFARRGQPIEMTFERFQYTFVNTMALPQQKAAFERYVVPESRRVPAEALTATARIDFLKAHPPLLLVGGGSDHIIPASLNRSNYAKYRNADSITDYKEFPGRTHFIIGQEGWEEVADHVDAWLTNKARIWHA